MKHPLKIKPKNRMNGGLRQTREARLVKEIVSSFGGAPRLCDKLAQLTYGKMRLRQQTVRNWHDRGAVPLEKCVQIGQLLKISPFALNYLDMCKMNGGCPSWDEVVRGCKLDAKVIVKLVGLKK